MINHGFFRPGERVRWVRAVTPDHYGLVGTILAVIPNDHNDPMFSMYEVQFSFGTATLYGTQIEAVEATVLGN